MVLVSFKKNSEGCPADGKGVVFPTHLHEKICVGEGVQIPGFVFQFNHFLNNIIYILGKTVTSFQTPEIQSVENSKKCQLHHFCALLNTKLYGSVKNTAQKPDRKRIFLACCDWLVETNLRRKTAYRPFLRQKVFNILHPWLYLLNHVLQKPIQDDYVQNCIIFLRQYVAVSVCIESIIRGSGCRNGGSISRNVVPCRRRWHFIHCKMYPLSIPTDCFRCRWQCAAFHPGRG